MQHVIPIPHKKHKPREKLEVKINKQEIFKSFILIHLMSTSRGHVLLLEFLLLIERWNIKDFVPLLIANIEQLFYLEDVDFECMTNNQHGYHLTQGNNYPSFVPWYHLVLVKDFKVVELGLALNNLNSPIEGQGVYIL